MIYWDNLIIQFVHISYNTGYYFLPPPMVYLTDWSTIDNVLWLNFGIATQNVRCNFFPRLNKDRALRFVYSDYTSTFPQLLEKSSSCTMEIKHLKAICTEVYKFSDNIGPSYIKNLFSQRWFTYSAHRHMDLCIPRVNQAIFDLKSFKLRLSKLWN